MPTAALSDAQIAALITGAGWTGEDRYTAFGIVIAESGGNPSAVNPSNSNGSRDDGLWQINSIHKDLLKTGNVYDPTDNTRMARRIYTDAGNKWTPWSTYNNQRYRVYRARAVAAFAAAPEAAPSVTPVGNATPSENIITDSATWTRVALFVAGAAMLLLFAASVVGVQRIASVLPAGRALKVLKG